MDINFNAFMIILQAVQGQYTKETYRIHPPQHFSMNGGCIELKYLTENIEAHMISIALSKRGKVCSYNIITIKLSILGAYNNYYTVVLQHHVSSRFMLLQLIFGRRDLI